MHHKMVVSPPKQPLFRPLPQRGGSHQTPAEPENGKSKGQLFLMVSLHCGPWLGGCGVLTGPHLFSQPSFLLKRIVGRQRYQKCACHSTPSKREDLKSPPRNITKRRRKKELLSNWFQLNICLFSERKFPCLHRCLASVPSPIQ